MIESKWHRSQKFDPPEIRMFGIENIEPLGRNDGRRDAQDGRPVLGGPFATDILCCCRWRESVPVRRQVSRGNHLDRNSRRYLNLSGHEIARKHGIVNQHFKCSERYGGGSVDDFHSLWIPSASMERRTGAHIRWKSAGRQAEARGHITPCSSLPSTVKTVALPSAVASSDTGVA